MIREQEIWLSVEALPPKKQLAFALLVLERMLPSLTTFSKDTGFDSACYLRARDAAWAALRNGAANRAPSQALNETCLRCAPDTERFSHELTSYALNAALAMSDILEFLSDGHVDHIAHVRALARDSVHLYMNSLEASVESSPEEDRKVANNPLMREEERREKEDVRLLSDLPAELDDSAISALSARASEQVPLLPLGGYRTF